MTMFTTGFLRAELSVGDNVLYNADMSIPGGDGTPLGWYFRYPRLSDAEIKVHSCGTGVAELFFDGQERMFVVQNHLTLHPKGKYRISLDVKMSENANFEIWVWDRRWSKEWKSKKIQVPVHDEWKRLDFSFAAPNVVDDDNCSVGICCLPPPGKTRLLIRNLKLEAMDQATATATAMIPKRWREPRALRIVPIDPVLDNVSSQTGSLAFYWPGEPSCGLTNCILSGSVDGKWTASTAFGSDGRVFLRFGSMPIGRHRLAVEVVATDGTVLSRNEYGICVRHPFGEKGPAGRHLNNFVTELVNLPLTNGITRFFCKEDGWVWIAFEGCVNREATGYLDDLLFPVVRHRGNEPSLETQRRVRAGWHRLQVRGARGGRLKIHGVKTLVVCAYDCGITPLAAYTIRFAERFNGLTPFNTLCSANGMLSNSNSTRPDAGYYLERGYKITTSVPFFELDDPRRMDVDESYRKLLIDEVKHGEASALNENAITAPYEYIDGYAEALWRLIGEYPGSELSTYIYDALGGFYYNRPKHHTSEISAMINTGHGKSMLMAELYGPTARDEQTSMQYIDMYARLVKSVGDLVPAAQDRTHLFVGTCLRTGMWTSLISPEADFKVHLSRMLKAFATRPDFVHNAGCALYGSGACDEELQRWGYKCIHYYCVEGGTEDLAEKYGYKWNPQLLRNGDFDDGLTGWDISPATDGNIVAERIPRYGMSVQGRQAIRFPGAGDCVAVITAGKDENRISQNIRGLVPGRLYALFFVTVDRQAVGHSTRRLDAGRFRARLEGAEEIVGLRNVTIYPLVEKEPDACRTWEFKYVFRATSSEAKLVFVDRAEDGAAPTPGVRIAFNYVRLRPYYIETPSDLDDIIETLSRK